MYASPTHSKLSHEAGRFLHKTADMAMMTSQMIFALVLVCGAGLTRGSPVFAHPDIIQFLTLEDRCLFICNICFDKKIPLMGVCANTVCPKINMDFFEVNQWISKRCGNYASLEATFFPKDTQAQI